MDPQIIYLILASICLVLPWGRLYGVLPLSILLLGLPVSNAFAIYFVKNGLFFYETYFLSLFMRLLIERHLAGRWAIFSILLIIFLALIALVGGVQLDVYFLRDFRLVLYLLSLVCLISLQHRRAIFTGRTLKWLAVLSGISCLTYAILVGVGIFQFTDSFYVRNSFRYVAISSYFCFGFFAFSSLLPNEETRGYFYYTALGLSLVGMVVTGLRVMSLLAIMLFIVSSINSKTRVIQIFLLCLTGIMFALFLQTIAVEESPSALTRIIEISPEILLAQIQTRFLPFFLEFENFGLAEVWLGGGFGQTFYIPWFSYRETVDDNNNYVDSTYLTLYAKFGVFSLLILAAYIVSYSRLVYPKSRSLVFAVALGLAVLFLVYGLPYQMTAIGFALSLFFIGSVNRTPNLSKPLAGNRR